MFMWHNMLKGRQVLRSLDSLGHRRLGNGQIRFLAVCLAPHVLPLPDVIQLFPQPHLLSTLSSDYHASICAILSLLHTSRFRPALMSHASVPCYFAAPLSSFCRTESMREKMGRGEHQVTITHRMHPGTGRNAVRLQSHVAPCSSFRRLFHGLQNGFRTSRYWASLCV